MNMIPTQTIEHNWILAGNNSYFASTQQTGKWCIFVPKEHIDETWNIIRSSVLSRQINHAMVSTAQNADKFNNIYCICVFTNNWKDKEDVFRVKSIIQSLGIAFNMKYKRDIDTMNDVEQFIYE